MISRVRLWRHLTRCHVADRCICLRALPKCPDTSVSLLSISHFVKRPTSHSFVTKSDMHCSLEANMTTLFMPTDEISKAIQTIETSVKNVNRVSKSALYDFLNIIETKGYSPDDNIWLLLMRCCGNLLPDEQPSERVNLVNRVWELLRLSGCVLNVDHYNALLHTYLENGNVISVTEFLLSMGDIKPNETTYLLLLELVCEEANIEAATDVISYMKRENLPANERMFNALLKCNARLRDTENCKKILETMQAAHISLSVYSFTALLEGFSEIGDITNVKRTYADAIYSSVIFEENHILSILRKTAISADYYTYNEVLHLFPSGSIHMTPNVVNLITHLVHVGKTQEAYSLLKEVSTDALITTKKESQQFGSFFIQEIVKTNQPSSMIVSICKDIEDRGLNSFALLNAAEAALSCKNVQTALTVFRTLKSRNLPLRPHYFWPILVTAAKESGEKGVFNILCQMRVLGVDPDSETLQDYVFPYCSLLDPVLLVRKLQDLQLKLTLIVGPLLAVLLKAGYLQHAQEICKTFKFRVNCNSLSQPLAVAYLMTSDLKAVISLIKTFSQISNHSADVGSHFLLDAMASKRIKIETKQIVDIIQAFKEEGIYISYGAADAIYYQLQHHMRNMEELEINRDIFYQLVRSDLDANPSKPFNNHMLHPREMNLEELKCHLVELQSKNMNTRGVLRKLLQMYCGQGDTQNAVKIEKEFETEGYEFSPGMYAALFDVHVKNDSLKDAEKYFTFLLQKFPDFKLDEYKVVDYATLLISSNKELDALHILKMFASAHSIKYPAAISRNCWKLLNTVAEKKNPKMTKEMLEIMVHHGYCSPTNVFLGPVIKTYLSCNDLDGAVSEYEHWAKELRRTPLQHELLCQVVSKQQHEALVKRVVDATKCVHGADATMVSHVAAVADAGSCSQLRLMLMDKRLNWPLFIQRCKRFVEERKLRALEKIASASQGLTRINMAFVYTCMLEFYCRQGDCKAALSLWATAQEGNIVPETEFLIKLASLLKSHKYDVPFTVPAAATGSERN